MKKFISLLLVAVMLCMGLSSCGDEPELTFTTRPMTRERYEELLSKKASIDIVKNSEALIKGELSSADRAPIAQAFAVKLFIGITYFLGDYDEYSLIISGENFKIDTSLSGAQLSNYEYKFYTAQREEYAGLFITWDNLIDNDATYPVDLYLTYSGDGESSGSIRIYFKASEPQRTRMLNTSAYIHYATDGEYIAYSVESIAAAQAALGK